MTSVEELEDQFITNCNLPLVALAERCSLLPNGCYYNDFRPPLQSDATLQQQFGDDWRFHMAVQELAQQADVVHAYNAYNWFVKLRQEGEILARRFPEHAKAIRDVIGFQSGLFISKILFTVHWRMAIAALEYSDLHSQGRYEEASLREQALVMAGDLCRKMAQDPKWSIDDPRETERFGWLSGYVATRNYALLAESYELVRENLLRKLGRN
jgi:hypothetical protein